MLYHLNESCLNIYKNCRDLEVHKVIIKDARKNQSKMVEQQVEYDSEEMSYKATKGLLKDQEGLSERQKLMFTLIDEAMELVNDSQTGSKEWYTLVEEQNYASRSKKIAGKGTAVCSVINADGLTID